MQSKRTTIQIFEHTTLRVGKVLKHRQWLELLRFHEQQSEQHFFTPVHKGVRFRQYVGVIQVGNLTIEILPKADRAAADDESKGLWQSVLIDLLRTCKKLKVSSLSEADLRLQPRSILDWYCRLFVAEAEQLIRHGLVNHYRTAKGNLYAFKGRVNWSEHLSKNAIHAERVYQQYQVYDGSHTLNQLLLQTLQLIPRLTTDRSTSAAAKRLALCIPEMAPVQVSQQLFDGLRFGRKTARYKSAMDIARLLLLNYHPSLQSGSDHVLALLFDMNLLWEEFLFRQLKQAAPDGWHIQWKDRKRFWGNHTMEADILVTNSSGTTIVLDAKWQALQRASPSATQLRQLFVYQQYWQAQHGCLVYPQVWGTKDVTRTYAPLTPGMSQSDVAQSASTLFVEVLTGSKLSTTIGKELIDAIKKMEIARENAHLSPHN